MLAFAVNLRLHDGMSISRPSMLLFLSVFGLLPLSAELPTMNEAPFIAQYAGFENKRVRIIVSHKGVVFVRPIGEKNKPVNERIEVQIELGLEEVMTNGQGTLRPLDVASLTAKQPVSAKFEKIELSGKVAGGATFEATIEQQRGVLTFSGRVVDRGTLIKNPVRFTVLATFPKPYPSEKLSTEKEQKALAEKTEDDRLDLRWTDGTRKKFSFDKPVDLKTKEVNGPGVADVEVDVSAYKGNKFRIAAGSNAAMTLWNEKEAPLLGGFQVRWAADAAKDPQNKARLTFEVK